LEYATNLHSKQTRKGSDTPFIAHLLCVSALILEDGGSEDEAIAGLLHDAVEDQGGLIRLEEIKTKFGYTVAGIILECSESHTHPKPPWKDRKKASISKMNNVSDSAIRVILADKIHNARSIIHEYNKHGEKFWDSFKAGKEGTVWYYKEILSVLKKRTSSILLDELSQLVLTIENLQESDSLSHLKNESKARPTFKEITPEELEEHRQVMREAARKASEAMKRGDHPKN
jgi:(p)ppGpp synthase/HD superfamily hydrolase